MEMTFRWYGESDPVTLDKIRQIPGVTGIVSAIYDIPVGEVWPLDKILDLKQRIEAKGLSLSVIESVPVHEDIKTGDGDRDRYIENYCETLRNLAKAGIDCFCYNFMPVFDWTRSEPVNGRSFSARLGCQLYKGRHEGAFGKISDHFGGRPLEQSEIFLRPRD